MQFVTMRVLTVLLLLVYTAAVGADRTVTKPDFVFSPRDIQHLATREVQLYHKLTSNKSTTTTITDIAKFGITIFEWKLSFENSLHNFNNTTKMEADDLALLISSNPILTFQMCQRFVQLANRLKELPLETVKGHPFWYRLQRVKYEFNGHLPTRQDVDAMARNIVTLQTFYNLEVNDILQGKIGHVTTSAKLTDKDAFRIGVAALNRKRLRLEVAFEWFHAIYENLAANSCADITKQQVQQILEDISGTLQEQYGLHVGLNYRELRQLLQQNRKLNEERLVQDFRSSLALGNNTKNALDAVVKDLCNRYGNAGYVQLPRLSCYLDRRLPAWALAPLRIEVHSVDPPVFQYHSVFTQRTLEYMKAKASPTMGSTFLYHNQTHITLSSQQVSTTQTGNDPILRSVEHRISSITGMRVTNEDGKPRSSADWHNGAYVFGGKLNIHMDSAGPGEFKEEESHSHIYYATFIVYMTEVQAGGYTVFPDAGVAVPPIKGSAAIWYGLKRNGDPDNRLQHGGCPVLLGQKWTSDKRIWYNESFLSRPCDLDRTE